MPRREKKTRAPLDHDDWLEWARSQVRQAQDALEGYARGVEVVARVVAGDDDVELAHAYAEVKYRDMSHFAGMLQRVFNSFDAQVANSRAQALLDTARSEPAAEGDIVEVLPLSREELRVLPSHVKTCIAVRRWAWDLFVELAPQGIPMDTSTVKGRLSTVFNDGQFEHAVRHVVEKHVRRLRKQGVGDPRRHAQERDPKCRHEVGLLKARYEDLRRRFSVTPVAKWSEKHPEEPVFSVMSAAPLYSHEV